MSNLIGKYLDRYHILEQLGEGGMATVYKAFDTRLERDVAIKVIRTELFGKAVIERILKRFEREAKALARLSHPNIVKVHDYGEYEDAPYLVLEYLPGGTLKDKLKGTPMDWEVAFRLLLPVVRALSVAHREKIIHRDLKPSNILLTDGGEPLLTDFGIAKILELDDGQTLTGTGVGVGTPEYMAPEQGLGKDVDARADIYALGVVLYEMITGRKPYTADTPMAVVFKHVSDPLPRPTEYVPKLALQAEKVLLKTLAKEPKNRYQNMQELAQAIEIALRGKGGAKIKADEEDAQSVDTQKTVLVESGVDAELTVDDFETDPEQTAWVAPQKEKADKPDYGIVRQPKIAPPPPRKAQERRTDYLPWVVGAALVFIGGLIWLDSSSSRSATPTMTPALQATITLTQPAASSLGIGSFIIRHSDEMKMLYIPAGEFEMGSEDGGSDEKPIHTVYLDAFWMDETEVTNAMYANCVNAGNCDKPGGSYFGDSEYSDHPVVYVSWQDAEVYCEWVGGSLPTEAEWEKAARGGLEGRKYPWGDESPVCTPDADNGAQFNSCGGRTVSVGSFSANGYGLYDMSGNVWEWVNDWHDSDYYGNSPGSNPSGPLSGNYRVLRGGSWYFSVNYLRSANRLRSIPDNSYGYVGFRCSRSLP